MQPNSKYHPPEYFEAVEKGFKGGVNTFRGHDPKKKKVRFSFPWDAVCLTCSTRFGAGKRFDVVKTRAGDYLGIPVWEFTFPCPECRSGISIRTNPQHSRYDAAEGVRITADGRVEERREPSLDPLEVLDAQAEEQESLLPPVSLDMLIKRSELTSSSELAAKALSKVQAEIAEASKPMAQVGPRISRRAATRFESILPETAAGKARREAKMILAFRRGRKRERR